jgi:hypothetical protein
MKINAYSDPGHGWAAVPLTLLDRLGLLDQITTYSYMRGKYAYLEEDCDLDAFMTAARAAGLAVEFRQWVSGYRRSRIRGYCHYSPGVARVWMQNAREEKLLTRSRKAVI